MSRTESAVVSAAVVLVLVASVAQHAAMAEALRHHAAVLAAFVQEFGGQDVLARPIDRGFNRLAWLVPYLVAAAALIGLGVTARRWSRRTTAVAGDAGLLDPALNARLDDELKDLD